MANSPAASINPPVILFGHGRSGTSILGQLIRDYLKIAFGTESQFIIDYQKRLSDFGSLDNDENLRRLIRALLNERWFKRSRKFGNFMLGEAQVFDAVSDRSYSGVLNSIFSLFAEHLEMERWGDKTPDYIEDLNTLDQLFPTAQYVYIVRDGRDVALSQEHTHFGPKNIFTAAHDWREVVRKGDAFAESLPKGRLFSLRYEDLIENPAELLIELGNFLYAGNLPSELSSAIESEVPSMMLRQNHSKWRKVWTESQRIAYEKIACSELRKHGYRTIVTTPIAEPRPFESTYWKILSEIGKWQFPEYWHDNVYKLRLRWNRVLRP